MKILLVKKTLTLRTANADARGSNDPRGSSRWTNYRRASELKRDHEDLAPKVCLFQSSFPRA